MTHTHTMALIVSVSFLDALFDRALSRLSKCFENNRNEFGRCLFERDILRRVYWRPRTKTIKCREQWKRIELKVLFLAE